MIKTPVTIADSSTTTTAVRRSTSINLVRADSAQTRKIGWLWQNRIPLGKLSLFVGDPEKAKSLVAAYVAARITTGTPWPDGPNKAGPCEVLMLCGEDDLEDTVVPRLQAAGADLSKVHFLVSVTRRDHAGIPIEGDARLDSDLPAIRETLKAYSNIRLIIIDPISNYLGDAEMNSEQKIRLQVLTPLKGFAAAASVAVLGVMHLNKKVDLGAIHRIGGAMGFVGVSRAVWLFMSDPDNPDTHHMLSVKGNLTKSPGGLTYKIDERDVFIEGLPTSIPVIQWTGASDKSASDLCAKPAHRPAEARHDAEDWLTTFLMAGPQPAAEILDQGDGRHGFSRRTLERAKRILDIRSYKVGKIWYWQAAAQSAPDPAVSKGDSRVPE